MRGMQSKPYAKEQSKEPVLLLSEIGKERKESMILRNERNLIPKLKQPENNNTSIWYLDNGASNHMTGQRGKFSDWKRV